MKNLTFYGLFIVLFSACTPSFYAPASVNNLSIPVQGSGAVVDSTMLFSMMPYSEKISKTMNAVVGVAAQELQKDYQFNTLGYFMTDAFLSEAKKRFSEPVHLALMNNGGIRANNLPKGNITLGGLFEIMPFDNLLVVMQLNGNQLQALLDHIASRGGWPISGATYAVVDKKAGDIVIDGSPIDPNKIYGVALSDYAANGGDDCAMLVGLPQLNKGYLQRDAIIDFVKEKTSKGLPIEKATTPRVVFKK